jgi:hypothetical protein
MEVIDLKELVRKSPGVTEEEVRQAVETIRQVEQLGGRRSQYNLVPPFSQPGSSPKRTVAPAPLDPRTALLKTRASS